MDSVLPLAKAIKASSTGINNAILNKSLYRGNWYFTRFPLRPLDKPYFIHSFSIIRELVIIKRSGHLRKSVFVFDSKDRYLIKKYDGIVACAKALQISHNTFKINLDKNIEHRGYIFSSHRTI